METAFKAGALLYPTPRTASPSLDKIIILLYLNIALVVPQGQSC